MSRLKAFLQTIRSLLPPPRRSLASQIYEVIFTPESGANHPRLTSPEPPTIDVSARPVEAALRQGSTPSLNRSPSGDSLNWGKHHLDIQSMEGHFLYLGKTGSGKSILMNQAIREVIRAVRPGSDRRVLLIDSKGDTLQRLSWMSKAGEVHVPIRLLSTNDRRADGWAVSVDWQRPDHAEHGIQTICPAPPHGDPFWHLTAIEIPIQVIHSFNARGLPYTLGDIYNASLAAEEILFEILRSAEWGKEVINTLLDTAAPQTTAGIKSQLYSQLKQLAPAAAASQYAKRLFSVAEFLQTECILVITQDFSARTTSTPFIQAFLQQLTDSICALPDSAKRKIFIFLDELRFLGKLNFLMDLVTFSRSKGGHVWMASQGVEGLRALYGQDVANEIFNQCDFKIFTAMNSAETARWVVSLLGEVPIWEPSYSEGGKGGGSVQYSLRMREHVTVRDLVNLPLPDPQSGLWAYYLSNQFEPRFYADFMEAATVNRLTPQRNLSFPAQVPRPNQEFYVRRWSNEEREAFVKGITAKAKSQEKRQSSSPLGREVEEGIRNNIYDLVAEVLEAIFTEQSKPQGGDLFGF